MLKQLTIRGFDSKLERKIKHVARTEGVSLNKAVLRLLRQSSAEPAAPVKEEKIGHSLDEFFGDWSDEEADAMLEAIKVFEVVDEQDWK